MEVENQIMLSWVEESGGLCAVNCLSQHAMEESILDLELVDRPILVESKG
jgi:hypothetical protein